MKTSKDVHVFVNPVAGGGRCAKAYRNVVRTLRDAGLVCKVMLSQYPGHITEMASELAAKRGDETIVVCGGDGTVNEVINGIAGTDIALGVVPLGTANDFAAGVGLSRDIESACTAIREGGARRIDLIRVNGDRFFAGVGCVGFDAEIAAFASRRRRDKSSAFLLHVMGGLVKFASYKPKTVELRFGGERYFGDILLVAFGNMKSYGRGMLITPEAEPDDSLLDICVVRPMSRLKMMYVFPSLYKGGHVDNNKVTLHQSKAVYVQSVGPMDFYADGDFMTHTPFRLEVMPNYLNVIVGALSSSPVEGSAGK